MYLKPLFYVLLSKYLWFQIVCSSQCHHELKNLSQIKVVDYDSHSIKNLFTDFDSSGWLLLNSDPACANTLGILRILLTLLQNCCRDICSSLLSLSSIIAMLALCLLTCVPISKISACNLPSHSNYSCFSLFSKKGQVGYKCLWTTRSIFYRVSVFLTKGVRALSVMSSMLVLMCRYNWVDSKMEVKWLEVGKGRWCY